VADAAARRGAGGVRGIGDFGHVTAIAPIERTPAAVTPRLAVSPDARWIAYAQVDESGTDIEMLEDVQQDRPAAGSVCRSAFGVEEARAQKVDTESSQKGDENRGDTIEG
jgi:hypothetical protein